LKSERDVGKTSYGTVVKKAHLNWKVWISNVVQPKIHGWLKMMLKLSHW